MANTIWVNVLPRKKNLLRYYVNHIFLSIYQKMGTRTELDSLTMTETALGNTVDNVTEPGTPDIVS